MLPLILAATLSQVAAGDEWRPYTANPRYEVYGHEVGGVFRYTRSRPTQPKRAVPNFGLSLPPAKDQLHGATDFEVRGTDPVLGKSIAEAASRPEVGQCPGPGPCPKPGPRPEVPGPEVVKTAEKDLAILGLILVVGAALALFGVVVIVALIAMAVRAAWRALTEPPAPQP